MSKVVLVTGASGFLASHIVYQLLEKGYRVKATARGRKVGILRELYANNPSVEVVEIADIVGGQFGDVFEGVDAVIHTASPLPGRVDPEVMMDTAIEGSLNVLRQAEKAGVKKFVVTSSIVTVLGDPTVKGAEYGPEHWNPVTKEIAIQNPGKNTYAASKKYAELAVWEWADAHPHVDVTTILPSYIYGPFPSKFPSLPKPDFDSISTTLLIYNILFPSGHYPQESAYIDFRDVARAHVGALDSKPDKDNRKRILVSSPHGLTFKRVLEIIKKAHPELEDRFAKAPVPEFEFDKYNADFTRIEEVTGMRKEDFHTLEETILDGVNDLLKLEEEWKNNGYAVNEVPLLV